MKRKRVAQILVPVLILIVIIGIWYGKKNSDIVQYDDDAYALEVRELQLDELLSMGQPVMLDFGASWCGPCNTMKPELEQANNDWNGKAYIKYIDIDLLRDVAEQFPVTVVPTQVFYDANGEPYKPSETIDVPLTQYVHKTTGEHLFTVHEGILTAEEIHEIMQDMGAQ